MLYEDSLVRVGLPDSPAIKGHVVISMKSSFDLLSEDDFAQVLSSATFVSSALFEGVGAQGSNIICSGNRVDVVARSEGDGLSLRWNPSSFPDNEMTAIYDKIKDKCDYIDVKHVDVPKQEVVVSEQVVEKPVVSSDSSSDSKVKNYLIRKLDRLP